MAIQIYAKVFEFTHFTIVAFLTGAAKLVVAGSVVLTFFVEARVLLLRFTIGAEVSFIALATQFIVTGAVARASIFIRGAGGHGLVATLTEETGVCTVATPRSTGGAVEAIVRHIIANVGGCLLSLAGIATEAWETLTAINRMASAVVTAIAV